MSAIHVIEYLGGIAIFGLVYWLLDGIIQEIAAVSLESNIYDLYLYVWIGSIIIYLLFGFIWLVRKYDEREYSGGLR